MATTTNYGWTTPDDTDLVKDGAAAIRTLGSSIDTSFVADEGDLLVGGTSDIFEALPIGAAGTVLTSDGDTAEWVAPAAGGAMTLINTTSFTTSGGVNIDSLFSATYTNYQILLTSVGTTQAVIRLYFRAAGSTDTSSNYFTQQLQADQTTVSGSRTGAEGTGIIVGIQNTVRGNSTIFLQNPFATASTGAQSLILNNSDGACNLRYHIGNFQSTTSFTGLRIEPSTGTFSGTVSIYGMAI
jgi:hypothetical protein